MHFILCYKQGGYLRPAMFRLSRKMVLVMRLTALLLFVACMHAGARGLSQNVTLSAKNATLKEVFQQIGTQARIDIIYKEAILKEAMPVTVNLKNVLLRDALTAVLKAQPFSFEFKNGAVVVKRAASVAYTLQAALPPPADTLVDVTGKVTDGNGAPVGGATVTVRGTRKVILTNHNGDVLLTRIRAGATLVINSLGYETEEIQLKNDQHVFGVQLKVKVNELNSLEINTGMFTRKRESFTGAVSTFSGEQLKTIGNRNILESLKTLDPSFIMVENNQQGSNPNALPTIEIRGKTSISTTNLNDQYSADPNQPLFILDGFESTLQAIYNLDMNRVASVTILKDAASTALYGAKAANGVVVVETKRPLPGQLRGSYSTDLSFDLPDLSSYNLMNASEKLQFEKLSGIYNAQPAFQWENDQRYNNRLMAIQSGVNSYWLNEPVHLGFANRQSMQLSGGSNDLLFNAGGSYSSQNGVMKGSGRKTWAGNFSLTYRRGKLNITNLFNISGSTATESPYGTFSTYAQTNPYYAKRNADGSVSKYLDSSSVSNIRVENPLYNAGLGGLNQTKGLSFSNNLQGIYTLSSNLRVQGGLMLGRTTSTAIIFNPPQNTMFDGVDVHQKGNYSNNQVENTVYSANLMVSYAKVIRKHQLNANVRTDIQRSASRGVGFTAVGFPNGTNGNPAYAYGYTPYSTPSSSVGNSRSAGFLGSLNYSYDQRFLLDATYRLEGASVFGSNKLFKPFASGGIGWNLHRERFLRGMRWLTLLKLRGDVGYTGNENLGQFTSVSTYTYQQGQSNFGQGVDMSSLGNPNLEWQGTLQQSYGMDFTVLNNRVSGYVEYYVKRTDPLVIGASGTLPSSTGTNAGYMINAGTLTTKGWSFNLRLSPVYNMRKRIIWTVGITGGTVNSSYSGFGNKLQALNKAEQDSKGLARYNDGYSPDDMWAVVSRGIDPATGSEIFQKKDGSYTFTYSTDDIVRVGNTRPKIEGVVNTTFTYKNFSIGGNMRYRIGGYLFNSALYNKVENISLGNLVYNQDKRALYERWKTPGDVSQFKSISYTTTTPMSSRFIEKDTHFIGESFNISWRVYNDWVKQLHLQGISMSFYLNDIFRLETVQSERGTGYPFARTASFSVNVSF